MEILATLGPTLTTPPAADAAPAPAGDPFLALLVGLLQPQGMPATGPLPMPPGDASSGAPTGPAPTPTPLGGTAVAPTTPVDARSVAGATAAPPTVPEAPEVDPAGATPTILPAAGDGTAPEPTAAAKALVADPGFALRLAAAQRRPA